VSECDCCDEQRRMWCVENVELVRLLDPAAGDK
jgi:hypothetical protein